VCITRQWPNERSTLSVPVTRLEESPHPQPDVRLLSLARRIGRLLQPLRLDVLLGTAYDMAPSWPELGRLGEYRYAAGLWRHLKRGEYTIIGSRRARALYRLARRCDEEGVPGALLDCGCFNGGSTVMMAAGAPSRPVWAFDSFEGLPAPGPDDPDRAHDFTGTLVASEKKVREAFRRFAPSSPPHIARGWFRDSFPTALPQIGVVALLHVDGDWYDSVKLTLETFEPRVQSGGFIVIDDYGAWEGARAATDEYRDRRGIVSPLTEIDQTAAYWRTTDGA
jgi:hypothetical protein